MLSLVILDIKPAGRYNKLAIHEIIILSSLPHYEKEGNYIYLFWLLSFIYVIILYFSINISIKHFTILPLPI